MCLYKFLSLCPEDDVNYTSQICLQEVTNLVHDSLQHQYREKTPDAMKPVWTRIRKLRTREQEMTKMFECG